MKRSNRLVLIIGIVLAVAAFAGVIVLSNQRQATVSTAPTTLPTVYAKQDIPLGTVITQDLVETKELDVAVRPVDAYGDVGAVVGKTVRTDVKQGAQISPAMFSTGAGGGAEVAALLDPGLRAIAVTVDQSTGVGTLINVGDRVDLLIGFTADKIPQVTVDPTGAINVVPGFNPTSTKLLLQNMQVIGTLLPPPPASTTLGLLGHHRRKQLHPHRGLGARHPRGHRAAGRGHQVRPDRRLDQPRAALPQGLPRCRGRARQPARRHDHGHRPQDPHRPVRRPATPADRGHRAPDGPGPVIQT